MPKPSGSVREFSVASDRRFRFGLHAARPVERKRPAPKKAVLTVRGPGMELVGEEEIEGVADLLGGVNRPGKSGGSKL